MTDPDLETVTAGGTTQQRPGKGHGLINTQSLGAAPAVTQALGKQWGVKKQLPMKNCAKCEEVPFVRGKRPKPRRTAWVFTTNQPWNNLRICWSHMDADQRAVVAQF
jgi:hypothetical protein